MRYYLNHNLNHKIHEYDSTIKNLARNSFIGFSSSVDLLFAEEKWANVH